MSEMGGLLYSDFHLSTQNNIADDICSIRRAWSRITIIGLYVDGNFHQQNCEWRLDNMNIVSVNSTVQQIKIIFIQSLCLVYVL